MKKQIVNLIILAILCTFAWPQSFAATHHKIDVKIDGEIVVFDVPPQNISGKIMVPLKVIFEKLGAKVNWDGTSQTITATKNNIAISMKINEKIAHVNGVKKELEVAPTVVNGRALVPIKFISESLGAQVSWEPILKRVIITTNEASVFKREGEPTLKAESKNTYTSELLDHLVESTEPSESITAFRDATNNRRNGLLKKSFKFMDVYYPDTEEAKTAMALISPHVDKAYMMYTDLYGSQAKVEVHLIDEKDTSGLSEGDIRAKEWVTFVWLEKGNDANGNNLSEFLHEVNHNFYSSVNGTSTNTMWLNEANAKLIGTLYLENNYTGKYDSWNINQDISKTYQSHLEESRESKMTLKEADRYLSVEKAWHKYSDRRKTAQLYGLHFWSNYYQGASLDQFKNFLRNMGNGSAIDSILKLSSRTLEEWDSVLNN